MIYLVGGAPRTGKSILAQRTAATLATSWISTDVLKEVLRVQTPGIPGIHWNEHATIAPTADWFFPYLECFIWAVSSMVDHYVIEGVDFLPAQVATIATQHPVRCVFLGCSAMTHERFAQFPGLSPGYLGLPHDLQQQIVQHVPTHSELIRREANHFGYPYIDMSDDFQTRLREAEATLTGSGGYARPATTHVRAAALVAASDPINHSTRPRRCRRYACSAVLLRPGQRYTSRRPRGSGAVARRGPGSSRLGAVGCDCPTLVASTSARACCLTT
jgi:hypothetical protein